MLLVLSGLLAMARANFLFVCLSVFFSAGWQTLFPVVGSCGPPLIPSPWIYLLQSVSFHQAYSKHFISVCACVCEFKRLALK